MKSIKEAMEFLTSSLKLTPICSLSAINQNGEYLSFDGLRVLSPASSGAKFSVLVAANSLNQNNLELLNRLDELNRAIFEAGVLKNQGFLSEIRGGFVSSELFVYSLSFEIQIKRVT